MSDRESRWQQFVTLPLSDEQFCDHCGEDKNQGAEPLAMRISNGRHLCETCFFNDPVPEAHMSDDALAALHGVKPMDNDQPWKVVPFRASWGPLMDCFSVVSHQDIPLTAGPLSREHADRIAAVMNLPSDHPLRTGEPSEAMKRAIQDAITVTVKLLDDEADAVGRAALAVLREPLDKPPSVD